jgi:N-hydroxyarylamine O-acetyltransferase
MRLHDYAARLGVAPAFDATAATLHRLHAAHRRRFLFENLTIQAGGAISVALGDLERKFLGEGRGGYCFEHNTLFAAALRDCGFDVTVFLGRVRRGPPELQARTHMVLRVATAESPEVWLADVGFGALGLLEPIPLRDGASAEQLGLRYRLRRERAWILSARDAAQEIDLYEFLDEPQLPIDVVVANHYTSTHPESIFRRSLTIQAVKPERGERLVLRGDTIDRWVDGVMQEEHFDPARLREVARDLFGVDVPAGPLVYEQYAAGV